MQGSKTFKELNIGDKFIFLLNSPNILTHEIFMKIKYTEGVISPPREGYGSGADAISLMSGGFVFVHPENKVLKLATI